MKKIKITPIMFLKAVWFTIRCAFRDRSMTAEQFAIEDAKKQLQKLKQKNYGRSTR